MRRSLIIFVVLFGVGASRAHATTIVPMSFTELVNASATVVYARVADVRGQWTANRQGIESLVTLDVLTPFKGAPGQRVTFSVAGGQAGRYINLLPGAPKFSAGDLVVVFLTARGARMPITTGFTQGVYRVSQDASSGAMVVVPPMVDAVAGPSRITRGDPQRRPLTLAGFHAAVRAAQEAAK
jgi:hypothetical protein